MATAKMVVSLIVRSYNRNGFLHVLQLLYYFLCIATFSSCELQTLFNRYDVTELSSPYRFKFSAFS